VKEWRKIYHAQKKVEISVIISDKINIRKRKVRDKESHCLLIKGSILQENIIILNMHVPKNRK
jgi:hypothetical protein